VCARASLGNNHRLPLPSDVLLSHHWTTLIRYAGSRSPPRDSRRAASLRATRALWFVAFSRSVEACRGWLNDGEPRVKVLTPRFGERHHGAIPATGWVSLQRERGVFHPSKQYASREREIRIDRDECVNLHTGWRIIMISVILSKLGRIEEAVMVILGYGDWWLLALFVVRTGSLQFDFFSTVSSIFVTHLEIFNSCGIYWWSVWSWSISSFIYLKFFSQIFFIFSLSHLKCAEMSNVLLIILTRPYKLSVRRVRYFCEQVPVNVGWNWGENV